MVTAGAGRQNMNDEARKLHEYTFLGLSQGGAGDTLVPVPSQPVRRGSRKLEDKQIKSALSETDLRCTAIMQE